MNDLSQLTPMIKKQQHFTHRCYIEIEASFFMSEGSEADAGYK